MSDSLWERKSWRGSVSCNNAGPGQLQYTGIFESSKGTATCCDVLIDLSQSELSVNAPNIDATLFVLVYAQVSTQRVYVAATSFEPPFPPGPGRPPVTGTVAPMLFGYSRVIGTGAVDQYLVQGSGIAATTWGVSLALSAPGFIVVSNISVSAIIHGIEL